MKTSYKNNQPSITNLQCDAETLIKSLVLPNWANNKIVHKAGSSSTSKPPAEPFGDYFQRWLVNEEKNLVDLRLATSQLDSNDDDESVHERLQQLVHRVMFHYEDYYKVKSESVEHDVVYMLNAPWLSPLERTFLWIGGWRATTAFHLLYTVVGLQLEARLAGFLQGLSSSTTPPENLVSADDLSPAQLVLIDELQKQTIRQERELSEALASLQEALADSSMVQLSHLATTNKLLCDHYESVNEQVKSNLKAKEDKLKEVFWKADELRITMFKKVIEMLSPLQAAHFLIAAAELHLRLHEWGSYN